MRLAVGLLLSSCFLESFTPRGAKACSISPNDICCSSEFTYQQDSNESYIRGDEKTMTDTNAMNESLPTSLRVLCFGDSLTAGYTKYGYEHHPYADNLRADLRYLLSTKDVNVEVEGLSGDLVQGRTAQFLRRIKAKCPVDEPRQYDWIIIMGGTNDLGWGHEPYQIYQGLSKSFRVFSSSFLCLVEVEPPGLRHGLAAKLI